ncbi:hypothetical protein BLNAU_15406 [Blattamonas nauphoetae]|uniref:Protein kinase domain-containing protein n=1 Tax=Blattamonas nauphoetae TaxID=2049346 RepID=A0ABQ9XE50_9EUKA|nr:hypothetical protein BLNAU_15406 [Blattamonas nauphoetae]
MLLSPTVKQRKAICLYSCPTVVPTIKYCFFHDCNATEIATIDGGAIRIHYTSQAGTVRIEYSSFTMCNAIDCGGAICITDPLFTTINNCLFESCAARVGGATMIECTQLTSTDVSIVKCRGSVGAGLFVQKYPTHTSTVSTSLSSWKFRDNVCQNTTDAHDINARFLELTPLTASSVQYCDSTSGSPNVYLEYLDKKDSDLVPQVRNAMEVKLTSIEYGTDTAVVTVTAQDQLSGQMSVMLLGETVPKLVIITFENSNIGTATVLAKTKSASILEKNQIYTFGTWVFPGYSPTNHIHSAKATLLNVNTTTITVAGISLSAGLYSMLVKEGNNEVSVSLNFDSNTLLSGTTPLYPDSAEHRLKYNTTYTIILMKRDLSIIPFRTPVTFTTPEEPSRIENVSCWLNGKKDQVMVTMNGRALTDESLSVVVSRGSQMVTSSSFLFDTTKTETHANFSVGRSENDTHVLFGGVYTVISAEAGGKSFYVNPGKTFTVPNAPTITKLTADTEVNTSSFTLRIEGSYLPSGKTYTATLKSGQTFTISFSSSTAGVATIAVGKSGNVGYDTDCEISSVILKTDGQEDEHVLLSVKTFRTPRGPTLNSISCDFTDATKKTIQITLGTELMPSESFQLVLVDKSLSSKKVQLSLVIVSPSSHTEEVEIFVNRSGLEYGHEYEVESLKSDNVDAVLKSTFLKVPTEPSRLTTNEPEEYDVKEKTISIVFGGIKLDGEYNMTLSVNGSEANPKVLGITFVNSVGTLSGILFDHLLPSRVNLNYGTTYEVKSLVQNSNIAILDKQFSFETVPEPSRLIAVKSATFNADATALDIVLTGCCLESKQFSLTLQNTVNSADTPSISVVFSSETEGSSSPKLYPTPTLLFGSSYTIEGVQTTDGLQIHLESGLEIAVDVEPARVENAAVSLNSKRDVTIIKLTGRVLKEGKYRLTLVAAEQNTAIEIDGEYNTTDKSILFLGATSDSDPSILEFGQNYIIDNLTIGSQPILVNQNVSVSVPNAPMITKLTADTEVNTSSFTLRIEGSYLPSGKTYTATLKSGQTFTISFSSSTAGVATIAVGKSGNVGYDTDCEISSVILKTDGQEDEHVLLSVKTFRTPRGPTLNSISCDFTDATKKTIQITLGTELMPSESFQLVLVDKSLSSKKVQLSLVIVSPSSHTEEVEIFVNRSGLEYGHEYEVESLKSDNVDAVLKSTFLKVPTEPSRLTTNEPEEYDVKEKTISIVFGGIKLDGEYNMTLSVNGSEANPKVLGITFVNSVGTLSGILFDHLLPSRVNLNYGTTYEVKSLVQNSNIAILDKQFSFETVPEPSRLIAVKSATFNADATALDIVLTGCCLESKQFSLTLQNTVNSADTPSISVVFSSETEGSSSPKLYPTPTLLFGSSYTIEGVQTTDGLQIHLESGLEIAVDVEPARVENAAVSLNSKRDVTIIKLTGRVLKEGKYRLTLVAAEQNTAIEIDGEYNTTDKSILFLGATSDSDPSILEFGQNYIIDNLTIGSQPILVNQNVSVPVPHPPRVTAASFSFSNDIHTACRHRRQNKAKSNNTKPETQELLENDEKFEIDYEINDTVPIETKEDKHIRTDSTFQEETSILPKTALERVLDGPDMVMCISCTNSNQVIPVSRRSTLYNYLHHEKKPLSHRRATQIQITKGIAHLTSRQPYCQCLQKLSSEWILLGSDGRFHLKMEDDATLPPLDDQTKITGQARDDDQGTKTAAVDSGLRWQAPEQAKGNNMFDIDHVAVFRLGLVLYEIETGLIPFGETDAVNAHRQLKAGTIPNMDGVQRQEMKDLIAECLAVDPNSRPRAADVADRLDKIEPDPDEKKVDDGIIQ